MLNLDYIFTKFDYFYYIFLFLGIFFILIHTNIVNYNNIIAISISFLVIYVLINNYSYREMNKLSKSNIIYNIIDYSKYPYLNRDEEIILIITRLKPLFLNNSFEYKKLLKTLDNFFYLYEKLRKMPNNDEYDILYDYSKKILNIVNSMGVNINYSENLRLKNIISIENKLKIILSKYLTEIEILINSRWHSDEVNSHMKPIYPDDINGTSYDKSNYNLY